MFLHLDGGCDNKEVGKLHFLWKDDTLPIYIMDEHQGALACWLLETKTTDDYTLFHIDYHWDATDISELELKTLAESEVNLDRILSLRIPSGRTLIDWTNYISALVYLRPNLRKVFFGVDQDKLRQAGLTRDHRAETFRPTEFISNLEHLLTAAPGKLLMNIDFDFLFEKRVNRRYPDSLLVELLTAIKGRLGPDLIVTAAWTPFLCGGCDVAGSICKLFCETLQIKCPTEELPPNS